MHPLAPPLLPHPLPTTHLNNKAKKSVAVRSSERGPFRYLVLPLAGSLLMDLPIVYLYTRPIPAGISYSHMLFKVVWKLVCDWWPSSLSTKHRQASKQP